MRIVIALAAAAVISGVAASGAAACSCAGGGKVSLRDWDAAVTARLIHVEVTDRRSGEAIFRYKVRRVFKGKRAYGLHRGSRLPIESNLSGATCGLPRQRDRLYGLLLYEQRGSLQANLCTVTSPRSLRRAAERRREGTARVLARRCADGSRTATPS